MKHGSLFSGIGGFDLAAQWMGWENKFHCEWNPFGQKVLKHYWPGAESFNDITKTDFKPYANRIDILTGGFPCQPYSLAGKRKGKEDERHLWPEMLRAIREIQPSWVVGENVFGLINWSDGLVFHEVQADLETEGYEVFPYVLPACAVNAPHRRDRVWFVAYRNDTGNATLRSGTDGNGQAKSSQREQSQSEFSGSCAQGFASNTHGNGQQRCHSKHEINESEGREYEQRDIEQTFMHSNSTSKQGQHIFQQEQGEFNRSNCRDGINQWKNFPTKSPICSGDDGLPRQLDGITFPKWRTESIKAYGNAIVPQVAYQIFKTIEQFDA